MGNDLHQHIEALRGAGLLRQVDRAINKDTQMHPLVRWQYRGGVAEEDRKAWLFTNVTDAKGRSYDMPVLVGGLAGNRAIYRLGMGCELDEIPEVWINATNNPIKPEIVDSKDAPCHALVFEGADLHSGNGLDALPIPISTPGWDNAPYTSSSHFVTRNPQSGRLNVGNYRGQIKARDRLGMNPSIEHHTGGYLDWLEWKKLGRKMPCAVILGCPPVVSFAAVQKLPDVMSEYDVAGGLAGEPIQLVQCKSVDLLVPAASEVVIEGLVDTEYLEPEAPFGESHGHVNLQEYNAFMDVTAITRRQGAVITSWISQVAPSESSAIKRPAHEAKLLGHLRDHLGIQGLEAVSTHEPLTSLQKLIVLTFQRGAARTEIWRAMYGATSLRISDGKWIIAVNDDIDADDTNALFWAMSYRAKPHRDVEILPHQHEGHGPRSMIDSEDSSILIDATLKEGFPPISLPKRAFMEEAAKIWDELGLPELKPEVPWFGYDLGEWNDDLERMAERAVKGDYWETGKISAQRRRKDVAMNTETRTLTEDDEPD